MLKEIVELKVTDYLVLYLHNLRLLETLLWKAGSNFARRDERSEVEAFNVKGLTCRDPVGTNIMI